MPRPAERGAGKTRGNHPPALAAPAPPPLQIPGFPDSGRIPDTFGRDSSKRADIVIFDADRPTVPYTIIEDLEDEVLANAGVDVLIETTESITQSIRAAHAARQKAQIPARTRETRGGNRHRGRRGGGDGVSESGPRLIFQAVAKNAPTGLIFIQPRVARNELPWGSCFHPFGVGDPE